MLTDEQRKEIEEGRDNLGMVNHPEMWPAYPLLPLMRYPEGKEREHGFLIDGHGPIIHIGHLFDEKTLANYKALPKKEYESFQQMLDDGWIVD